MDNDRVYDNPDDVPELDQSKSPFEIGDRYEYDLDFGIGTISGTVSKLITVVTDDGRENYYPIYGAIVTLDKPFEGGVSGDIVKEMTFDEEDVSSGFWRKI